MSDKKLKYRSAYNCHSAQLTKGLGVAVNWATTHDSAGPWIAYVFGDVIGRFKEFDEAENAVIDIALQRLRKATDVLEKAIR